MNHPLTHTPNRDVPTLETNDLTIRIDDRILCDRLSISMNLEQSWAILGPNGTGKTTLLHTLAALRAIDCGTVSLFGRPLDDYGIHELALMRSILFQQREESFPCTVMEAVLSGRHPHIPRWGSESLQDIQLAEQLLQRVDMSGMMNRDVTTLSGGERQRVNIAAVLAQQTPIRLFDEPTSHLDLRHQTDMLELITDSTDRLNILVLHDINQASRHCSHVLLMYDDGHVEQGPVEEILTLDRLEPLYGCHLRVIQDTDDHSYFVTA